MPMFFLDSSAIAKRYVREKGSDWIDTLFVHANENQLYIANFTGDEVIAAIARRSTNFRSPDHVKKLIAEFRDDYAKLFRIAEMNRDVLHLGMDLAEKHRLRGYDALQLSTALEVHLAYFGAHEPLILVSADDELNKAAVVEGLRVENPNVHS